MASTSEIPEIDFPASTRTVIVRVIDTTTRINMPTGTMFKPPIKGHDRLSSPSYSFLIENQVLGRKVLFDLGTQKNWREQAPTIVEMIDESGWDVQVDKDVAGILQEHGIPLTDIESIIWSHSHWDHLGDPSTFPTSTGLIVGPGFLEEYFPDGLEHPEEDCPIKVEFYKNRTVREVEPEEFTHIMAGFPAHDYFGDGSFYLIDSPGHDIGHLSALARVTTNPDTFVFLGGDIASHPGEFRPTEHVPLPRLITPNPINLGSPKPCPGHIFKNIHPVNADNVPFYKMGTWPDGESVAADMPSALESHKRLRLVDAQSAQVFVILAHDENVGDVIDLFPKSVNDWKERGWGHEARWMFLGDFRGAIDE